MAVGLPDNLSLERHRDWHGRGAERWLPPTLFLLFVVLPVVALFGVFGQTPKLERASDPNGMATLELRAPTKVRSGLLFQARFDIRAQREIKNAVLVLGSGWLESLTLNTSEPAPSTETSSNGSIALHLGDISAGKLWRQYLEFQANPVNAGWQHQDVSLYDGKVQLLHLNRKLWVWP